MREQSTSNQNILKNPPLLISILAAIVVFIIALLIIEQRRNIKITQARFELATEMKRVNFMFNDFFSDMYSGLAAITRIIDDKGNVHNFDTAAKEVLANNSRLTSISLIPGGTIKYTYPATNHSALGKSILYAGSKEEAAGALAAFKSKKIVIAGPFTNFSKRESIAARLPVVIGDKFWGFASALISLEDLLKTSNVKNSDSSKYGYSLSYLSYINGKECFFLGNKPADGPTTLEEQMSPINWKFYITAQQSSFSLFWLPSVLSLLGSVIVGFSLKRTLDKTFKLQTLVFQKDRQIAEAQKEFKAIFDNAPIGFALINQETRKFSNTNETFRRIFGLEAGIFPEGNEPVAGTEEIFSDMLAKINEINDENAGPLSGDYKHVTKQGDEIWTHYKLFALPAPAGQNRKYVVIAEDITEKLAAERKLKHSEKKYRYLFDESPVALWEEDFSEVVALLRKNGMMEKSEEEIIEYFTRQPNALASYTELVKIKSINDECFRQYKFNSKEELFAHFPKTLVQDSNLNTSKKILAAICTGKHQFKSESLFYDSEGKMRTCILSWQVIPGHEENYDQIILTTVDITDLKNSKEELRKSLEKLDHQNKRLLDFSYIVSHNLRSHASNIQSLTDLILSSQNIEEKKELVIYLHKVVKILGSSIDALNDVVTINADIDVSQQQVKLREAVDKTVHVLSDKIRQKEGVILNNIPKDTTIFHNRAYIESILLNLISNSLKYSKPNVCPVVSITYNQENYEKILTVNDNGIGIDLEKNGHKLFGLFKTFTHNPDAKGVGLYITKRQIEAMGGRITVDSIVNVGTTFKIYFK
ncbi:PAS domain S-box protein [Niabella sp. CJ426]|uniref:PAS domain S-box protein n=1 Tax=Niabella sp. CJ426 TaxID=3393740 RepID=UPI003CFF7616